MWTQDIEQRALLPFEVKPVAEDVACREERLLLDLGGVAQLLDIGDDKSAPLGIGRKIRGEVAMKLADELGEPCLLNSKSEAAALGDDGLCVGQELAGGDGGFVLEFKVRQC